jgi:hypothetical protein
MAELLVPNPRQTAAMRVCMRPVTQLPQGVSGSRLEELLPRLRNEVGSQRIEGSLLAVGNGARELDTLKRCAVIAGKREEEVVAPLKRCVDDLMREPPTLRGRG